MKTLPNVKITICIIGLYALILFTAVATFAHLPVLRANGKIAFTSDRDGNREIYVMNPDGSNQVRLTNNNVIDDLPKWSPDGSKIAFLSQNHTGTFSIFIMNPDGSNKTEVTPTIFFDGSPPGYFPRMSLSWSPDGQQIVFSEVVSTTGTLMIVNVDGSNRHVLTSGFHPAWSPDGSKILFSRSGATFRDWTLNTINADGTGFQTLPITLPSQYYHSASPVSWSPDSSKFAFVAGNSANSSMFIVEADGSNRQTFIDECGTFAPVGCGLAAALPSWSPDGRAIAFAYMPYFPQIAVRKIGEEAISLLTNTLSGINTNPNWQPISAAIADFDGDGRSDISVFRPSDRSWYLDESTQGLSVTQFGLSTDKLAPADYDGDGKTDISVFRDGIWYWVKSSNGTVGVFQFGLAGDIPVPADYTGDGRDELAVYRGGTWYSLDLTNDQTKITQFGISTDKPVPADFDGDGRIDQAIYRNGDWHINRSSQGYTVVNFGLTEDRPIVADYDGDGRADQAVYRKGTWYLLKSSTGFTALQFGLASDIPTPADYDGDGLTDIAVYRDGTWYIIQSSTGGYKYDRFGLNGDIPVASVQFE